MPRHSAVRGQEGPRVNINADGPPQLLDAIVQRAVHFIAAQELLIELRDHAIALLDLHLEDGGVLVGAVGFTLGGLAGTATRSTVSEPGRLGDHSRRMGRIRIRITNDVIERIWSN